MDKLAVITLDTVLSCIVKNGNEAKVVKIALEIASIIEGEFINEKVNRKKREGSSGEEDLSSSSSVGQGYLLSAEKQNKNLKAINMHNRSIRSILQLEEWPKAAMVRTSSPPPTHTYTHTHMHVYVYVYPTVAS